MSAPPRLTFSRAYSIKVYRRFNTNRVVTSARLRTVNVPKERTEGLFILWVSPTVTYLSAV